VPYFVDKCDKYLGASVKNSLWVWCDLEMTGLDVETDTILEVCCVITTPELNILTPKPFHKVIYHNKMALDQMSEWCIENHQLSGLTDDVLMSQDDLTTVEKLFIDFLQEHTLESDMLYLAGNSIHTDRAYIKRLMPGLESLLHYRMIDVTAIAMFLETIGMKKFDKASSHRACDDIIESINELKYYKKQLHDN